MEEPERRSEGRQRYKSLTTCSCWTDGQTADSQILITTNHRPALFIFNIRRLSAAADEDDDDERERNKSELLTFKLSDTCGLPWQRTGDDNPDDYNFKVSLNVATGSDNLRKLN